MISMDDRTAILDLCARYNYAFDTCASEAWASTFTADGVLAAEGDVGGAEGREALIEFCNVTAKQFAGGMHFTDNHLFEEDGAVVRHKCYVSHQMPVDNATVVTLVGYTDELVKVDGEWRFRSRHVGPLRAGD